MQLGHQPRVLSLLGGRRVGPRLLEKVLLLDLGLLIVLLLLSRILRLLRDGVHGLGLRHEDGYC